MKYCDYCDKDVQTPCKELSDVSSCKNAEVKKEDVLTIDVPYSMEDKGEYKVEVKGERGYSNSETVDHPKHYNRGNIEVITFTKDQKLCHNLATAVKYICRAGFKDPAKWQEDLEKSIWYIKDLIDEVNKTGEFPYVETKSVPRNKD